MDGGLIIVLDYEKICRLCLQSKGVLSNIFEFDDEVSLVDQVKLVTSVDVVSSDMLPKQICHKCRHLVELCYDLRTTVIKSNQLLCESTHIDLDKIQVLKRSLEKGGFCDEKKSDLGLMDGSGCEVDGEELKSSGAEEILIEEDYLIKEEDYIKKEMDCNEAQSLGDLTSDARDNITISEGMSRYSMAEDRSDWSVPLLGNVPDHLDADQGEREDADAGDYFVTQECETLLDASNTSDDNVNYKKHKGSYRRAQSRSTCQLCLVRLSSEEDVEEHVSVHYTAEGGRGLVPYTEAVKPLVCQLCPNQTFAFRKDLLVHHRQHLGINPYACQVQGCGFVLRSKEALRHHMYSHGEKKFVCEVCGSAFRRKFELGQHRTRHQDEGAQFRCTQCQIVCKNRLSFRAHLKHHEIGRRFKCNRQGCPKAFYSNTDLIIHERSHSNDKCYKCPLCVCAYISQSQLNRHLRQHQKRRVNKCDKCSESFSDYSEFCNHRIKTHGEWHPHKCPACNQGYQNLRAMERHLTRCRLNKDSNNDDRKDNDDGMCDEEDKLMEITFKVDEESSDCLDIQQSGTSVIIHAADLEHLTTSERVVCGESFLYISSESGGIVPGKEDKNDVIQDVEGTKYMIIKNTSEDNNELQQYACKVVI